MLILKGTAEYTLDDGDRVQGSRYNFIMMSIFEDIDKYIEKIGIFLGDLGWNEIDIKETRISSNDTVFDLDGVMKDAFSNALKNEFSVIVYGEVNETVEL